ncbi:hypothetical protein KCP77_20125 [Salmonella enterica subsp. enterica]|nr:hypothetical protein KCP77_20125 [Salmonella enterica subsp. enterica]
MGFFVLSPADTGDENQRCKPGNPVRRNVAGLDPGGLVAGKEKTPHIVRYSPATLRG